MKQTACMYVIVAVALVGAVAQGRVVEPGCPNIYYAYPFQGVCTEAAQFGVEYHLVAPYSNAAVAVGGITPDSDSLIRFTGSQGEEGAKYVLKPTLLLHEKNITRGSTFIAINSETNKILYLTPSNMLAEGEEEDAYEFQFELACDVPLPCPDTTGARCESYYLTTSVKILVGTTRDNITYVQSIPLTDSTAYFNLPFLLRKVSTSDNHILSSA